MAFIITIIINLKGSISINKRTEDKDKPIDMVTSIVVVFTTLIAAFSDMTVTYLIGLIVPIIAILITYYIWKLLLKNLDNKKKKVEIVFILIAEYAICISLVGILFLVSPTIISSSFKP